MLEKNKIADENIDRLIEDYMNKNFNPIGLYFNAPGIITKLGYWKSGSPIKIKNFTRYENGIPEDETLYLGAAANFLKNLRMHSSSEDNIHIDSQYMGSSGIVHSMIKLINFYKHKEKNIKILDEDYDNIIIGISDVLHLWKMRNKSRIREIDDTFDHFSKIYSKEDKKDVHSPNKLIDAIRAVIDPEKHFQDMEQIYLSDRDVRPYLVFSPVYKNGCVRYFNSDEEKRVSDLVNNLEDRNSYNENHVWGTYCNRGKNNGHLTPKNMFAN